jgi:2-methylcitrate dehydratase PrpD
MQFEGGARVIVTKRLAGFLDALGNSKIEAKLAEKLALHLFDALGVLVAGRQVADAGVIVGLAGEFGAAAPSGMLPEIGAMAAAIRCTEIDDIHLLAGVTPSAAIVPVLLSLAGARPEISGVEFLRAYLGGLEVMIRFARAAGGPRLLQRGIWPSRLSAGMGAAAATAVLLGLSPDQKIHALSIAGAMASGLSPRGAVPSSRWLIFGRAVEDGVLAARAAARGLKGDPAIFDGQWHKATGITFDSDLFIADIDGVLLSENLGLKPWCAARQTMAAILGFRRLLNEQGIDAQSLTEVLVEVPEDYVEMISAQNMPGTRPASFANLRYLFGLAAFAPEGLGDVQRDDLRIDPRFEDLAKCVQIAGDAVLSQAYPARWPARVTAVTADGQRHVIDVPDVPGDAVQPLDWADVEAKCVTAAGVPIAALAPLKGACRNLPETGSPADLHAAVVAALGV